MARDIGQHRRHGIGTQHATPSRHQASDIRRGTARERGYSTAWDKFSRSFLRAHPLCEYCAAEGKTVPAQVTDHDLPHQGDTDLFWVNTFTALCARCHNGPKASAEARLSGDALLRWVEARKRGKAR